MVNNIITLAIETAIEGGSISLIKDDTEIDFWIGKKGISKAEDLLEQISGMLKSNRVKKINLVAVSGGPGSATGIRIGQATALGLKKSFNCEIVKVALFEALAFNKIFDEQTLMAVPVGRKQIACHIFEKGFIYQKKQVVEPEHSDISGFLKLLENRDFPRIVLHGGLTEWVINADRKFKTGSIEIISDKIATAIGLRGKRIKFLC